MVQQQARLTSTHISFNAAMSIVYKTCTWGVFCLRSMSCLQVAPVLFHGRGDHCFVLLFSLPFTLCAGTSNDKCLTGADTIIRFCLTYACCVVVLMFSQAYAQARIQRFAHAFARRINPNLTKEQVDYVTAGVINEMAALQEPMQVMPQQNLRLVLRHDCL